MLPQNISSLYIHFPFCSSFCNYCDFYKVPYPTSDHTAYNPQFKSRLMVERYQEYLQSSLSQLKKMHAAFNFKFSPLETLYLGGGSPSLWGEKGAFFIKNFLFDNKLQFNASAKNTNENYEFTLEVNPGIPGGLDSLEQWREVAKVNRLSVGIQTLDENYFPALERKHTLKDVQLLLEYLSTTKFNSEGWNYSVDLLIGLPEERKNKRHKRNIIKELETILSYHPSHISTYILTPKCGYHKKLQRLQRILPTEEEVCQEYLAVSEFLTQKGFIHYEVSNFSLPGRQSKHNLKYWRLESVAALGPSATGLMMFPQSEKRAYRYKWHKWPFKNKDLNCSSFLKREQDIFNHFNGKSKYWAEKLGDEEIWTERVYLLLRTNLGLDPTDFFDEEGYKRFLQLLNIWQEKGYLAENRTTANTAVRLSTKGFLLLDTLMVEICAIK